MNDTAEEERQEAIHFLGELTGRPKLAQRLIREGVDAIEARARFSAVGSRVADHIQDGWNRAIASVKGERGITDTGTAGSGWGAAIAKVFGARS